MPNVCLSSKLRAEHARTCSSMLPVVVCRFALERSLEWALIEVSRDVEKA